MKIHWRICVLLSFVASISISTVSANGQIKEPTSFCFVTADNCACLKQSAKSGLINHRFFFKDRAEDNVTSNRCVNRTQEFTLPSFGKSQSTPIRIDKVSNSETQGAPSGSDAEDLAKKLSNPVASLISVPFQENLDFGMGAGSGWRSTLNIQPVIPISLNQEWNLISRTILPIIHQHNVQPNSSQTGLGDITQSFFFSPAESKRAIWGIGPALLIPTATNDALGTEKFGIGPTALVLKQQSGWTYGALVNHIWSVAGSDTRSDVNNTFIQPFLAYNTKDAWTFTVNTESSYDWEGNHWNVPVHFVVSKLIKIGHHPVSVGGGIRCWATSSPGGPDNCGLRILFTPLFPK